MTSLDTIVLAEHTVSLPKAPSWPVPCTATLQPPPRATTSLLLCPEQACSALGLWISDRDSGQALDKPVAPRQVCHLCLQTQGLGFTPASQKARAEAGVTGSRAWRRGSRKDPGGSALTAHPKPASTPAQCDTGFVPLQALNAGAARTCDFKNRKRILFFPVTI